MRNGVTINTPDLAQALKDQQGTYIIQGRVNGREITLWATAERGRSLTSLKILGAETQEEQQFRITKVNDESTPLESALGAGGNTSAQRSSGR